MDTNRLQILGTIIMCIIIAFGIPGNLISIVVWTRGYRCSKTSFSVYFILLAVSDIIVLLVPGTEFVLYLNNILPRNTSHLACKFFSFCVNFCLEMSAWITVTLTLERTIIFCFPMKFYKMTKLNVYRFGIMSAITIVLISINLSYIPKVGVVSLGQNLNGSNITSGGQCDFTAEVAPKIYMAMIVCFHIVLPISIIIICNIIIIVKLCRSKKLTKAHPVRSKSIRNVTILTVCLSLVHCVSTLPETLLVWFQLVPVESDDSINNNNIPTYNVIANLCLYLNNSVNCILYCFIGTEFRQDLIHLCKACTRDCCRTYTIENTKLNIQHKYKYCTRNEIDIQNVDSTNE